jgi:two-component system chemotaxis response regulator CheY
MMPEIDGQETLETIRNIEYDNGIKGLSCVKIIMTTALDNYENLKNAFGNQCDGYLVKPIEKTKVMEEIKKLGILA